MAKLAKVTGASPVLVIVKEADVLLPTLVKAKDKLGCDSAMVRTTLSPAPSNTMVCGLPEASPPICNAAERSPCAEGLNTTYKLQIALGGKTFAKVARQVFWLIVKSPEFAPVME
jgi:hypothetical protein